MARVTVEDCVLKVPNRFELVMVAAHRARELHGGAPLQLDRDNDKDPVVALREIADDKVSCDDIRNQLIKGHQKVVEVDEVEPEIVELMAGEQGWVRPEAETAELSMDAGSEEEAEDEAELEDEDAEAGAVEASPDDEGDA